MLKKSFYVLVFAIFAYAHYSFADNVPQPVGWINDFAGVIQQEYRDKLDQLVHELEEKTNAEIAVVTVNSIAPYDERQYARMLFDSWKPGKKGKDSGVIVLLAVKERRWRIETGYGVEGLLPDGLCGDIGRNYMVPDFKAGRYGEGLYNGVIAIAQIIAKDAGVQIGGDLIHQTPDKFAPEAIKLAFIIFVIFWIVISSYPGWIVGNGAGRRKYPGGWGYPGGLGGGFGGGGFGGGGGGGGGAGGGF